FRLASIESSIADNQFRWWFVQSLAVRIECAACDSIDSAPRLSEGGQPVYAERRLRCRSSVLNRIREADGCSELPWLSWCQSCLRHGLPPSVSDNRRFRGRRKARRRPVRRFGQELCRRESRLAIPCSKP